jgi:hypothetical protein
MSALRGGHLPNHRLVSHLKGFFAAVFGSVSARIPPRKLPPRWTLCSGEDSGFEVSESGSERIRQRGLALLFNGRSFNRPACRRRLKAQK